MDNQIMIDKINKYISEIERQSRVLSLEVIEKLREWRRELEVVEVKTVQENANKRVEEAKDKIQEQKVEVEKPKEEVKGEINQEVFERARAYLKEKWYKGYWLLKWENMITKAIENWFII